MLTTVAWGLLVLVVVAVMLHCEHLADLRRIAKAQRAYQAALDRANALGTAQDGDGPARNTPDVRDWSRPHQNGPENAKYEGVHRERRHY